MARVRGTNGEWEPAKPIEPKGPVAKLEFWLRSRGLKRIPNLLGRWDERKLGR